MYDDGITKVPNMVQLVKLSEWLTDIQPTLGLFEAILQIIICQNILRQVRDKDDILVCMCIYQSEEMPTKVHHLLINCHSSSFTTVTLLPHAYSLFFGFFYSSFSCYFAVCVVCFLVNAFKSLPEPELT